MTWIALLIPELELPGGSLKDHSVLYEVLDVLLSLSSSSLNLARGFGVQYMRRIYRDDSIQGMYVWRLVNREDSKYGGQYIGRIVYKETRTCRIYMQDIISGLVTMSGLSTMFGFYTMSGLSTMSELCKMSGLCINVWIVYIIQRGQDRIVYNEDSIQGGCYIWRIVMQLNKI